MATKEALLHASLHHSRYSSAAHLNSVMCSCGLCWSGASGCFQLRVASRFMLLTIQYRSETCGGGAGAAQH